jgi:hypothetical protein
VRSNQASNVTLVLAPKIKRTERSCDHKGRNCKINRRDAEVSFELKAAEIQEIPVEVERYHKSFVSFA